VRCPPTGPDESPERPRAALRDHVGHASSFESRDRGPGPGGGAVRARLSRSDSETRYGSRVEHRDREGRAGRPRPLSANRSRGGRRGSRPSGRVPNRGAQSRRPAGLRRPLPLASPPPRSLTRPLPCAPSPAAPSRVAVSGTVLPLPLSESRPASRCRDLCLRVSVPPPGERPSALACSCRVSAGRRPCPHHTRRAEARLKAGEGAQRSVLGVGSRPGQREQGGST
jgi:hypothetical protein